jgi:DNA-directed RNA polymerase specialized sigma24 family protein
MSDDKPAATRFSTTPDRAPATRGHAATSAGEAPTTAGDAPTGADDAPTGTRGATTPVAPPAEAGAQSARPSADGATGLAASPTTVDQRITGGAAPVAASADGAAAAASSPATSARSAIRPASRATRSAEPAAASARDYPTHRERVVSAEVKDAITRRLRSKGVPAQDIDDERQEVTYKLLAVTPEPPNLAECTFLALKMASEHAVDYLRKGARRGRMNEGATDQADEHAREEVRDPHHLHGKLAVAKEVLADGSRRSQMLAMSAAGYTNEQIGQRFNVKPQTAANTVASARKEIHARWAARLAVGGGVVVVVVAIWSFSRQDADRGVVSSPPPPRTQEVAPPSSATPRGRAAALRAIALDACTEQRWKACADGLDEAKKLDPSGESLPEVRDARDRIDRATHTRP